MPKIFIIFAVLLLSLFGCNYMRTFPLYSEVYIEHLDAIKINYYEISNYNTPEMLSAFERVKSYLDKNPSTSFSIKSALLALSVEKEMDKEQVRLVIGDPWRKETLKDGTELWTYEQFDKKDFRFLLTLNHLNTLKFKNGILADYDRPEMFDRASVYLIRKRVEKYFDKNHSLDPNIETALSNLKITKGMDKEQVILIVGNPTTIKNLQGNNELWIYNGDRIAKNERPWYYEWGKLTFHNGLLEDIEVQYIHISK